MNLFIFIWLGFDILFLYGFILWDDLSLLSMLFKEYFLNVSIKLLYFLFKIGIENRYNLKFLNDKEFKIVYFNIYMNFLI